MQYYWLNKKENDNLIIFFCGWSFDYKPFERLDCGDSDVLVIYDYYDMKLADLKLNYKTCQLVTWSMGVYVAYLLRDLLPKFNKKIAINGTPYPIDDEFGIPVQTFDLTLKYVDTGLKGKFQKNLFKRPEDYKKYTENPVGRSIDNQKAELIALNDFIKNREQDYEDFYDCAIISDTDKIIPTRNQINFWQNKTKLIMLDSGHFPFFEFNSWNEIVENADKP